MIKFFIFTLLYFFCSVSVFAQAAVETESIKLFVKKIIDTSGNKKISEDDQERIYDKTVQIINNVSIAYIGFSNFLVIPKFTIINVQQTDAGIQKLFSAKCEYLITINRVVIGDAGGATFKSFRMIVNGSGYSKDEAIRSAIDNLPIDDPLIADFLTKAKIDILNFYKNDKNCQNVLKEAEQAYKLRLYDYAIALLFSIPNSSPCFKKASDLSVSAYDRWLDVECQKNIISAKAYIAQKDYSKAITYLLGVEPTSENCFEEAKLLIKSMADKINQKDKMEWEEKISSKKAASDIEKEKLKNMQTININYSGMPGSIK